MLDSKSSRLYNSLGEDRKELVQKFILNSFVEEKSVEEIAKTFIDEAIMDEQDKKDKDPVYYMYLRMLDRIINGQEKYVKHVEELHDDVENEYFNHPANNLVIVFDALNYDICSKTKLVNKDALVSLLTSKTIDLDSLESKEHVHLLDMGKLCGDKVFSRDSIRELDGVMDYVLKKYMSFYLHLFKKPNDDIKKIIK